MWIYLGALTPGRWAPGFVDPLREAEHSPDHHREGQEGEGGHGEGKGWGHGTAMGTQAS